MTTLVASCAQAMTTLVAASLKMGPQATLAASSNDHPGGELTLVASQRSDKVVARCAHAGSWISSKRSTLPGVSSSTSCRATARTRPVSASAMRSAGVATAIEVAVGAASPGPQIAPVTRGRRRLTRGLGGRLPSPRGCRVARVLAIRSSFWGRRVARGRHAAATPQ